MSSTQPPLDAETCSHCGLPLPRPLLKVLSPAVELASGDEPEPAFCCFGCRLAAAISGGSNEEGLHKRTLARLGLAVFFSMNVMAFTMALWTGDIYPTEGTTDSQLATVFSGLFRHLVLLFSLPVLFLLGLPLWDNAVASVKRGVFSTDLLLGAGVLASFVYSSISVIRGEGPIYFEVGCVVLVMVTLGRWLEATGKHKANDALDRLARLMPGSVRLLSDDGESLVALEAIQRGDLVRVLAGERIPADGWIESGVAFVDQQVITGESSPQLCQVGDDVVGGTLNLDGDLRVRVTAPGTAGTLARMIDLVRSARLSKGRYEQLADRVSTWFVPIVTVVAASTFLGHAFSFGIERGILQALAVVLIACPCALGLATPLAVWSALGQAATRQVLFRSGESLERLAQIKAVRFDKTGTLTTGEPVVAHFLCEDEAEADDVLSVSRSLALASSHVLASVVGRFAASAPDVLEASSVHAIAGRGISAAIVLNGTARHAYLGSRRMMAEQGQSIGPALLGVTSDTEAGRQTSTWVAWDGKVRGVFTFSESLRPSAVQAIERCRALGLDLMILTGDHAARGEALSLELRVAVRADLLPEDKVSVIQADRAVIGAVAMVGDGVNDAPALAASDVGVALGCGTDLSRESAALCLLGNDLDRLPWAIALARRTTRIIRWNLLWAFGYNAVGVGCAALGWLSPALAAFLMVGSSGFVILNSLRLQGDATHDPALESPPRPVALGDTEPTNADTEPSLEACLS